VFSGTNGKIGRKLRRELNKFVASLRHQLNPVSKISTANSATNGRAKKLVRA
jgi:hypothetical protein